MQDFGVTNAELWHRGPPARHPLDEYERPLWGYRPGAGRHLICDRWHIGELVYPPVLGRMSRMTDAAWWHIELFLRARGAVLIKMTADEQVLTRRFTEAPAHRRGSGVDLRHLGMITSMFTVAFEDTLLPSWEIHNGDYTHEQLWRIVDWAHKHERQAIVSGGWFETYVGPPRPDLLLLGDVRGGDAPRFHGPAFAPYSGTSGLYLLHALRGVSPSVPSIGLANACDVDNVELLWDKLGQPETVTLGRNADRCVGWEHRAVPHPQFVRRFANHERRAYAAHILSGIEQTWSHEAIKQRKATVG